MSTFIKNQFLLNKKEKVFKHFNDKDEKTFLLTQIVYIADFIDVLKRRFENLSRDYDEAISYLKLFDFNIDEYLKKKILEIVKKDSFWLDILDANIKESLLTVTPSSAVFAQAYLLEDIAKVFIKVIDEKSKFTAKHSEHVAQTVFAISKKFGWTDLMAHRIKVAGYFHNIGKLVVPNNILDKPSGLDKKEWNIMKSHTYYFYWIIKESAIDSMILAWASFHHETP